MDFNSLIAELRASSENLPKDSADRSLLSSVYCNKACKVLDEVSESTDYDTIITGLWLVTAHFAEQLAYLKPVPALSELCFKLFRQCAKAVLNIQWQNLEDDSSLRQNFLASLANLHAKLVPFDFPRFRLLEGLTENPWTNPTLAKVMGGEVEDGDKEEVRTYIEQEDPIILQLRVDMMLQENCEEYALNLCNNCLSHPELQSDLGVRKMQLSLLYKLGQEDKLQEECQKLNIQDAVRIIKQLQTSETHRQICTVLAQTFMVQNWIRPSDMEANKELLRLWIRHQLLVDREQDQFKESVWAMAKLSQSTEQIVIFIDVLREECGEIFLQLYVDMCIFAINVDKGQMETNKKEGNMEAAAARRSDMASICAKLSCLCHHASIKVARICALTSFALKPTELSFAKIGTFYGQGSDCCNKCGRDRNREPGTINPATLYEVERLLNMLRPDYLSPEQSYANIQLLCRRFLQESLKNAQQLQRQQMMAQNSGIATLIDGPANKLTPAASRPKNVFEALSPQDYHNTQMLLNRMRIQSITHTKAPAPGPPGAQHRHKAGGSGVGQPGESASPSLPGRANKAQYMFDVEKIKSKQPYGVPVEQQHQYYLMKHEKELEQRRKNAQKKREGKTQQGMTSNSQMQQQVWQQQQNQEQERNEQVSEMIQTGLQDSSTLQKLTQRASPDLVQAMINIMKGSVVKPAASSDLPQQTGTQQMKPLVASPQPGTQPLPTVSTLLKPSVHTQQAQKQQNQGQLPAKEHHPREQSPPRRHPRPQLYAQPISVSSASSVAPRRYRPSSTVNRNNSSPITSATSPGEKQKGEGFVLAKSHVEDIRRFMQMQMSNLQQKQIAEPRQMSGSTVTLKNVSNANTSFGFTNRPKTTVEIAEQAALAKLQKRDSSKPGMFQPSQQLNSNSGQMFMSQPKQPLPKPNQQLQFRPSMDSIEHHQHSQHQQKLLQSHHQQVNTFSFQNSPSSNMVANPVLPSDELSGSIMGVDDTIIKELLQDSGILANTFPDIEVETISEDKSKYSMLPQSAMSPVSSQMPKSSNSQLYSYMHPPVSQSPYTTQDFPASQHSAQASSITTSSTQPQKAASALHQPSGRAVNKYSLLPTVPCSGTLSHSGLNAPPNPSISRLRDRGSQQSWADANPRENKSSLFNKEIKEELKPTVDQLREIMKKEDIEGEVCMDAANNATYRCIICSIAFESLDHLREHVRNVCKPGLQSSSVYNTKIKQDRANSAKAGVETTTVFQCLRCFELCVSDAGIKQHRLTCKRVPTVPSDLKKDSKQKVLSKSAITKPPQKKVPKDHSDLVPEPPLPSPYPSLNTEAVLKSMSLAGSFISQTSDSSIGSSRRQAEVSSSNSISKSTVATPAPLPTLSNTSAVVSAALSVSSASTSCLMATSESQSSSFDGNMVRQTPDCGTNITDSGASMEDPLMVPDNPCAPAEVVANSASVIERDLETRDTKSVTDKDPDAIPQPSFTEITGSGGSKFYKCGLCSQTLCSHESFLVHWKECAVKNKNLIKKLELKEKACSAKPISGEVLENLIRVIEDVAAGGGSIPETISLDSEFSDVSDYYCLRDPWKAGLLDLADLSDYVDSDFWYDFANSDSQESLFESGADTGETGSATGSGFTDNMDASKDGENEHEKDTDEGMKEEDDEISNQAKRKHLEDTDNEGRSESDRSYVPTRKAPPKLRDRKTLKPIHSFINETFNSHILKTAVKLPNAGSDEKLKDETEAGTEKLISDSENESDGDSLYCKVCRTSFQTKRILLQHFAGKHLQPYTVKTVADSSSYFCHLCQKTYSTFMHYMHHVPNHSVTIYEKMKAFIASRRSQRSQRIATQRGLAKKGNMSPKMAKALKSKKAATKSAVDRLKQQLLAGKTQAVRERLKISKRKRSLQSTFTSSEDDFSSDASNNVVFKSKKSESENTEPTTTVRPKRSTNQPLHIENAGSLRSSFEQSEEESDDQGRRQAKKDLDDDYVLSEEMDSDSMESIAPPTTRSRKRIALGLGLLDLKTDKLVENSEPSQGRVDQNENSTGDGPKCLPETHLADYDADSNCSDLLLSQCQNGHFVPSESKLETQGRSHETGSTAENVHAAESDKGLIPARTLIVRSLSKKLKERLKSCDLHPTVVLETLQLDVAVPLKPEVSCPVNTVSEQAQGSSNENSEHEPPQLDEPTLVKDSTCVPIKTKNSSFLDSFLSYLNQYPSHTAMLPSDSKTVQRGRKRCRSGPPRVRGFRKRRRSIDFSNLGERNQGHTNLRHSGSLQLVAPQHFSESEAGTHIDSSDSLQDSVLSILSKFPTRRCSVNLGQKLSIEELTANQNLLFGGQRMAQDKITISVTAFAGHMTDTDVMKTSDSSPSSSLPEEKHLPSLKRSVKMDVYATTSSVATDEIFMSAPSEPKPVKRKKHDGSGAEDSDIALGKDRRQSRHFLSCTDSGGTSLSAALPPHVSSQSTSQYSTTRFWSELPGSMSYKLGTSKESSLQSCSFQSKFEESALKESQYFDMLVTGRDTLLGSEIRSPEPRFSDIESSDLVSIDIESSDLVSIDIESSELVSTEIGSSDLVPIDIESSELVSTEIGSSDLVPIDIESSELVSTEIGSSDLVPIDIESSELVSTEIGSSDLVPIDIESSELVSTEIGSSDLVSIDIESSELVSTEIRSSDLVPIDIESSELVSTEIGSSDLVPVDIESSELVSAGISSELEPSDLRSLGLRPFDIESSDHEGTDVRYFNNASADITSLYTGSADIRSLDTETADIRSLDTESTDKGTSDHGCTDVRSLDNGSADIRSLDTGSADIRSLDTETADIRSLDTETADVRSLDIETADIRSLDTETADIRSLDTETADIRSLDTESADKRTSERRDFECQESSRQENAENTDFKSEKQSTDTDQNDIMTQSNEVINLNEDCSAEIAENLDDVYLDQAVQSSISAHSSILTNETSVMVADMSDSGSVRCSVVSRASVVSREVAENVLIHLTEDIEVAGFDAADNCPIDVLCVGIDDCHADGVLGDMKACGVHPTPAVERESPDSSAVVREGASVGVQSCLGEIEQHSSGIVSIDVDLPSQPLDIGDFEQHSLGIVSIDVDLPSQPLDLGEIKQRSSEIVSADVDLPSQPLDLGEIEQCSSGIVSVDVDLPSQPLDLGEIEQCSSGIVSTDVDLPSQPLDLGEIEQRSSGIVSTDVDLPSQPLEVLPELQGQSHAYGTNNDKLEKHFAHQDNSSFCDSEHIQVIQELEEEQKAVEAKNIEKLVIEEVTDSLEEEYAIEEVVRSLCDTCKSDDKLMGDISQYSDASLVVVNNSKNTITCGEVDTNVTGKSSGVELDALDSCSEPVVNSSEIMDSPTSENVITYDNGDTVTDKNDRANQEDAPRSCSVPVVKSSEIMDSSTSENVIVYDNEDTVIGKDGSVEQENALESCSERIIKSSEHMDSSTSESEDITLSITSDQGGGDTVLAVEVHENDQVCGEMPSAGNITKAASVTEGAADSEKDMKTPRLEDNNISIMNISPEEITVECTSHDICIDASRTSLAIDTCSPSIDRRAGSPIVVTTACDTSIPNSASSLKSCEESLESDSSKERKQHSHPRANFNSRISLAAFIAERLTNEDLEHMDSSTSESEDITLSITSDQGGGDTVLAVEVHENDQVCGEMPSAGDITKAASITEGAADSEKDMKTPRLEDNNISIMNISPEEITVECTSHDICIDASRTSLAIDTCCPSIDRHAESPIVVTTACDTSIPNSASSLKSCEESLESDSSKERKQDSHPRANFNSRISLAAFIAERLTKEDLEHMDSSTSESEDITLNITSRQGGGDTVLAVEVHENDQVCGEIPSAGDITKAASVTEGAADSEKDMKTPRLEDNNISIMNISPEEITVECTSHDICIDASRTSLAIDTCSPSIDRRAGSPIVVTTACDTSIPNSASSLKSCEESLESDSSKERKQDSHPRANFNSSISLAAFIAERLTNEDLEPASVYRKHAYDRASFRVIDEDSPLDICSHRMVTAEVNCVGYTDIISPLSSYTGFKESKKATYVMPVDDFSVSISHQIESPMSISCHEIEAMTPTYTASSDSPSKHVNPLDITSDIDHSVKDHSIKEPVELTDISPAASGLVGSHVIEPVGPACHETLDKPCELDVTDNVKLTNVLYNSGLVDYSSSEDEEEISSNCDNYDKEPTTKHGNNKEGTRTKHDHCKDKTSAKCDHYREEESTICDNHAFVDDIISSKKSSKGGLRSDESNLTAESLITSLTSDSHQADNASDDYNACSSTGQDQTLHVGRIENKLWAGNQIKEVGTDKPALNASQSEASGLLDTMIGNNPEGNNSQEILKKQSSSRDIPVCVNTENWNQDIHRCVNTVNCQNTFPAASTQNNDSLALGMCCLETDLSQAGTDFTLQENYIDKRQHNSDSIDNVADDKAAYLSGESGGRCHHMCSVNDLHGTHESTPASSRMHDGHCQVVSRSGDSLIGPCGLNSSRECEQCEVGTGQQLHRSGENTAVEEVISSLSKRSHANIRNDTVKETRRAASEAPHRNKYKETVQRQVASVKLHVSKEHLAEKSVTCETTHCELAKASLERDVSHVVPETAQRRSTNDMDIVKCAAHSSEVNVETNVCHLLPQGGCEVFRDNIHVNSFDSQSQRSKEKPGEHDRLGADGFQTVCSEQNVHVIECDVSTCQHDDVCEGVQQLLSPVCVDSGIVTDESATNYATEVILSCDAPGCNSDVKSECESPLRTDRACTLLEPSVCEEKRQGVTRNAALLQPASSCQSSLENSLGSGSIPRPPSGMGNNMLLDTVDGSRGCFENSENMHLKQISGASAVEVSVQVFPKLAGSLPVAVTECEVALDAGVSEFKVVADKDKKITSVERICVRNLTSSGNVSRLCAEDTSCVEEPPSEAESGPLKKNIQISQCVKPIVKLAFIDRGHNQLKEPSGITPSGMFFSSNGTAHVKQADCTTQSETSCYTGNNSEVGISNKSDIIYQKTEHVNLDVPFEAGLRTVELDQLAATGNSDADKNTSSAVSRPDSPRGKTSIDHETDDGDDFSDFDLIIEKDTSCRSLVSFPIAVEKTSYSPVPKHSTSAYISKGKISYLPPSAKSCILPSNFTYSKIPAAVGHRSFQGQQVTGRKPLNAARTCRKSRGQFVWEVDDDNNSGNVPEPRVAVVALTSSFATGHTVSASEAASDPSLDTLRRKQKALREKSETAPFTWDLDDNADSSVSSSRSAIKVRRLTKTNSDIISFDKSGHESMSLPGNKIHQQIIPHKRPLTPDVPAGKMPAKFRRTFSVDRQVKSSVHSTRKELKRRGDMLTNEVTNATSVKHLQKSTSGSITVDKDISFKKDRLSPRVLITPSRGGQISQTDNLLSASSLEVKAKRGERTQKQSNFPLPLDVLQDCRPENSGHVTEEGSPKNQLGLRSRHSSMESNKSDKSVNTKRAADMNSPLPSKRSRKNEEDTPSPKLKKIGLIKITKDSCSPPASTGSDSTAPMTRSSEAAIKAFNQKSLRSRGVNPCPLTALSSSPTPKHSPQTAHPKSSPETGSRLKSSVSLQKLAQPLTIRLRHCSAESKTESSPKSSARKLHDSNSVAEAVIKRRSPSSPVSSSNASHTKTPVALRSRKSVPEFSRHRQSTVSSSVFRVKPLPHITLTKVAAKSHAAVSGRETKTLPSPPVSSAAKSKKDPSKHNWTISKDTKLSKGKRHMR